MLGAITDLENSQINELFQKENVRLDDSSPTSRTTFWKPHLASSSPYNTLPRAEAEALRLSL